MDTNKEKYNFEDFVEVIRILRSPNGCPWDREQTHDSIKKNLIEESYELVNEIDKNNMAGMKEELGDVLLQVLLHSQIAKDDGEFAIDDVIDGITKKMIFRHPHVFAENKAASSDEAYDLFKAQKNKEKKLKTQSEVLNSVPKSFPALLRTYKMAEKLHKMKSDVFSNDMAFRFSKIDEEYRELKEACAEQDKKHIEEELGDTLCTLVHLAVSLNIDAEIALNSTCDKVMARIAKIEEFTLANGEKIEDISAEKFIKYWKDAKILEK